jgi:hypothetical protein
MGDVGGVAKEGDPPIVHMKLISIQKYSDDRQNLHVFDLDVVKRFVNSSIKLVPCSISDDRISQVGQNSP